MMNKYGHIQTFEYNIRATSQKFEAWAAVFRRRRLALRLASFLCLLLLMVPLASAQTVEVGASVVRSSNFAPQNGTNDGGKTFPGAYVKAAMDLPHGFEVQVKARASRTPQLQTQFTTDEPDQTPAAELRISPEARYNSGRLFAGAGFEYTQQFFTRDNPDVAYSRSYNLNPTITVGVKLPKRQELSATYILEDRDTNYYGVRANYSYAHPVSDSVSVVVGVEANLYTLREGNRRGYVDRYYERDTVYLVDIGLRFGKAKYKN
jgi:hypothetical protein